MRSLAQRILPALVLFICDFQPGVAAGGTATYTLETAAPSASRTGLNVTEIGDAITVTTGPLRFVVSKTRFNLLDRAWLDVNGDGQFGTDEEMIAPGASEGPVVTASGTDYRAMEQPPASISVEEQGPMKVVINVAGRHYDGTDALLKYETRIYAYAGQAFIRLRHVYANGTSVATLGDSGNPAFGAGIDRYALSLRLNPTTLLRFELLRTGGVAETKRMTLLR